MITIFGASDDLIEVEGDISEEFNLANDESPCYLAFSDGTVLKIVYGKDGIWTIRKIAHGTTIATLIQCTGEDDSIYSDTMTLDGNIKWVVYGIGFAK